MGLTTSQRKMMDTLWADDMLFTEGMGVKRVRDDESPIMGRLAPLFATQEVLADTVRTHRKTLVLKSRRMGITTWTVNYLAARCIISPERRIALSMGHHEDSIRTMRRITKEGIEGLPRQIRPKLKPETLTHTGFAHNKSLMIRATAGGGSQGRGEGINDFHATEMGDWPQGSAANAHRDTSSDSDTWQSILASIDDPRGKIIVESTGNGPGGLFFDLYKLARDSPDWGFVFFPWTFFPRYSKKLKHRELMELERDLNDEEVKLRDEFDLTLEQIAWRRERFEEGATPLRFRREFPLTSMDPFLLENSGWFDQEALNQILRLTLGLEGAQDALQIFIEPEPQRRYFLGADTSGGTGGDDATIQIFRDDLMHVATWRSNRSSPYVQADRIAMMSSLYNNAMSLVELNKYGRTVINRCEELGVNLWVNDRGRPFYTQGAGSGNSKRHMYSHARDQLDHGWAMINHPATVHQLHQMVELPNGVIKAATGHDDLADAVALALWCGRGQYRREATLQERIERHRRRMQFRQNPVFADHRSSA